MWAMLSGAHPGFVTGAACVWLGCALLLRSDPSRLAMLVERLGPTLDQSGLPPLDRRRILVARAQRLWRITPDVPLPTGAEKGRWLIDLPVAQAEEAWATAIGRRFTRHVA